MKNEQSIRVIIAGRHVVMRIGVHRLLCAKRDVEVVACTGAIEDLAYYLNARSPDILVFDSGMSLQDVLRLTKPYRDERLRLVAFSHQISGPVAQQLLRHDIQGYFSTQDKASTIARTLRHVYCGVPCIDRIHSSIGCPNRQVPDLTDREREVLLMMSQGNSNKQIAERLSIAVNTVRNHISRIYKRIGVCSSRQAIAWAWRERLLQQPQPKATLGASNSTDPSEKTAESGYGAA